MNKHSIYLDVAEAMSQRATCLKLRVGAVIVRADRIVAVGFNGAPHGVPHCVEVGCDEDSEGHCRRALHAEHNAMLHAGVERTRNGILYSTHEPCYRCTQVAVQCGLEAIIYRNGYEDGRVDRKALLDSAGIFAFSEQQVIEENIFLEMLGIGRVT